jgi:Tol biopolymer transport system component
MRGCRSTIPSASIILSPARIQEVLMSRALSALLALPLCGLFLPLSQLPPPTAPDAFSHPQLVSIAGYEGDVMEPFLTRDGKYLFFNNRNDPGVNTNLYWADRVDDLHFRYRGEIAGVNTANLEAVASMDTSGNFYFVSNRSYSKTASTLYRAKFADGALANIELIRGVSLNRHGIVNFDAEISADGNTLYFVESEFSWRGQPKSARILLGRRHGNEFQRDPASETILQAINTGNFSYAPATSASECEIFFTRLDSTGPAIYTARRADRTRPFGTPVRIAAINGFAEAPTLSPDEKSLYYHKRENGKFAPYRVTRP